MRSKLVVGGLLAVLAVVITFSCTVLFGLVLAFRHAGVIPVGADTPSRVANSEPTAVGEALHHRRCSGCHTIDGSACVGPTFKGLYGSEVPLEDGSTVLANEEYIRESIVDPSARVHDGYPTITPSFRNLGAEEIGGLIAFIRSLE